MPNPTAKPTDKPSLLSGWTAIFKAGTHVDSKGRTATYTSADLDQMVANHAALGAAPAVLGHPKHDDPAYGWVAELMRDGDELLARWEDVHPQFAASVDAGAYRNRSVSLVRHADKGWHVQHVGWLGAVQPAIPGLGQRAYAAPASEAEVYEYAAEAEPELDALQALIWSTRNTARLLSGLRDHWIEQSGVDSADKVLPTYVIQDINDQAEAASRYLDQARAEEAAENGPMVAPAYSRNPKDPTMPQITEEQHRAELERVQKETEERTRAQFASQGAELAELRAQRTQERVGVQINKWLSEGRVTPAEQSGLAEFMTHLEGLGEATFQFSAAGTSTAKTPALWFAEFMSARQPVVKLGKKDDGGDDAVINVQDPTALAAAASQYMTAQHAVGNKSLRFDEAVEHIRKTAAAAS